MASSVEPAKLAKILECKICYDTYYKPKQLICGHTYCQDCLDGIVMFNKDGSAQLNCPLRCTKKTIIERNETTSSLGTAYALSEILDEMPNFGNEKSLCQQSRQCKQSISCSCTTCGAMICNNCLNTHSCQKKSYTNVIFNTKMQEVQPFCTQHNSLARNVCIDCDNTFICIFCIPRIHENHQIKTIAKFSLEVKNGFQSLISFLEHNKLVLENLKKECEKTLISLKSVREIFVRELKVRKLKRIEEYLKMLNAEVENMLREFDEKTEIFIAKVTSAGFACNTETNEFSDYAQVVNSKSQFALVAEKLEIEQNLQRLSSLPTIPHFNLRLQKMDDNDCYKNPLGELKLSIEDVNIVEVNPAKCSIYKIVISETKSRNNQSQLANDLTALIENLKEWEVPHCSANLDVGENRRENLKRDENLEMVPPVAMSFDEVINIITSGDDKKFQLVLLNNPSIATVRDRGGYTLLMEAAHYNKPSIVKSLIDAGSDVKAVNNNKWNAYHRCASDGHEGVLKTLINHDVTNINKGNDYNWAPLHFASCNGHIECFRLLLSIPDIDVNVRNNENETPLHFASGCGHLVCVKLLLSTPRIDVTIRDRYNRSAYDVARTNTIKRLLSQRKNKLQGYFSSENKYDKSAC